MAVNSCIMINVAFMNLWGLHKAHPLTDGSVFLHSNFRSSSASFLLYIGKFA